MSGSYADKLGHVWKCWGAHLEKAKHSYSKVNSIIKINSILWNFSLKVTKLHKVLNSKNSAIFYVILTSSKKSALAWNGLYWHLIQLQPILFANVGKNTHMVIFSWFHPGRKGLHHFTAKTNNYWWWSHYKLPSMGVMFSFLFFFFLKRLRFMTHMN